MLTLFILKSGNKDADPKKSLQSFIGLVTQTYYLNSLPEINAAGKENDWFAVIYDDEVVGKGLMDVTLTKDGETMNYCPLKVHLMQTKADVLVLYKKHGGAITRSPRIFRKHVQLLPDTLMPADEAVKFDTVLDGWIK